MTRTSSVAIVPRINGIRAIPPPGLSRSCMNVIIAGRETVVRRGQRTIWAALECDILLCRGKLGGCWRLCSIGHRTMREM